jgi:hypothetical protein
VGRGWGSGLGLLVIFCTEIFGDTGNTGGCERGGLSEGEWVGVLRGE